MTKETIINNYAIDQGYESWDNLVNEKINEQRLSLYYDFNAVTDLIQEELKKKIANIEDIHIEDFDEFGDVYVLIGTDKNTILNTEIL